MIRHFKRVRWLDGHQGSGQPEYVTPQLGIELDRLGYRGINEPYKVSLDKSVLVVNFDNRRLPEHVVRSALDTIGYDPIEHVKAV